MVNYWLAKQEPSSYNFSSLKKDKKTMWDGVHNNLALKHINNMKKGDLVFFYHSGDEKQAVGIMEITSKPYPNPKEKNDRFVVVDVKYKKELANNNEHHATNRALEIHEKLLKKHEMIKNIMPTTISNE